MLPGADFSLLKKIQKHLKNEMLKWNKALNTQTFPGQEDGNEQANHMWQMLGMLLNATLEVAQMLWSGGWVLQTYLG